MKNIRKTKIVCSMGPTTANDEIVEKLIKAGMNVARINFSHATLEEKENVVKESLNLFKETSLDFVDCILIAYNKIESIEIFSFDKKLNKKLV